MKKKIISVLLVFLITGSVFGCQSNKNGVKSVNIENTYTTYYKNGVKPITIENIDDKYYKVVIDYQSGISHKEMGVLIGKEIKIKIPDYEKTTDALLKRMVTFTRNSTVNNLKNAQQLIKNVNKDYVDELDGMASQFSGGSNDNLGDGKLSKNELYLLNLSPDLLRPFACSATSVYGSRTKDGKAIIGRSLEWDPEANKIMVNVSAVTIYKQGDKSFYNIGFVGFMGVISGFNKSKVFASILDAYSTPPKKLDNIRSYPFDIRYSLENNETLDAVASFMSDNNHNYYRDHIIFFSDANTSKVLENDIRSPGINKRRELRTDSSELNSSSEWGIKDAIATVNTFALDGNYDEMISGNIERWNSYKRLISESKSPVNLQDMKNIMSFTNLQNSMSIANLQNKIPGNQVDGSIYNFGSVQTIVFKPENLELEIAFAPRGKSLPPKPNFISIPVDFK